MNLLGEITEILIEKGELRNHYDHEDVLSKLKSSEESNDVRKDSTGFAIEDDKGGVVKVFVRGEQADKFEEALAGALDHGSSSKSLEIAEVLFELRRSFDIVDIVWPAVSEDEEPELDNEDDLGFQDGADQKDGQI